MKRSVRLGIVEKLAKQREDQAAQALAQVRAQLDVENNRLLELGQYREEYLGYLDQQGALGISMQQWRRTQGFIDQLADLAQRQQITIDGWHAREQQVLDKWQLLYQRRKNIGQYIDKLSIEEVLVEDKKEQKVIDELISQRFR
ncbi:MULTISPECIES: flagellar export protein FliJ [Reinekea]|uniref:Flagellar FliJ protein n=2 Tax=Reinekea TaxID=230494 RepID=A0A2K8KUW2_9GAMM|nr:MULTISPECIES: flagellar export protein FliJ [Reinekea]ATX76666.1 flagellar protein FliJ [Reinekea forsetii]MDO7644532.1 flagellar export protein FliJ [Reinekea forsetii]